MAWLDAAAGRYGCRPSDLLEIPDGVRALTIDKWAFHWGSWNDQLRALKGRHGVN